MAYVEAVQRIRAVQVDHIKARCKDPEQPLFGKRGIIHDMPKVATVLNMQAEHLRESSAGLAYLAAQLKVDLDHKLNK